MLKKFKKQGVWTFIFLPGCCCCLETKSTSERQFSLSWLVLWQWYRTGCGSRLNQWKTVIPFGDKFWVECSNAKQHPSYLDSLCSAFYLTVQVKEIGIVLEPCSSWSINWERHDLHNSFRRCVNSLFLSCKLWCLLYLSLANQNSPRCRKMGCEHIFDIAIMSFHDSLIAKFDIYEQVVTRHSYAVYWKYPS